ncbi:MAG: peroxiredoxin [Acidimicrobiaceae bacterium]|nr:peroxiredoxin [Acidimicrobiaceae bacterium]
MKIGDKVADFTLKDQDGDPLSLARVLEGGPVVLFFYPAAMTAGCTKESCHFRDLKSEFDQLGVQRVGISMDKVDKQKKFSDTYGFDYPLLSDEDGSVAEAFGVKRSIGVLRTKRQTFVIDKDSTVLAIFKSEFNMNSHAEDAIDFFRTNRARSS